MGQSQLFCLGYIGYELEQVADGGTRDETPTIPHLWCSSSTTTTACSYLLCWLPADVASRYNLFALARSLSVSRYLFLSTVHEAEQFQAAQRDRRLAYVFPDSISHEPLDSQCFHFAETQELGAVRAIFYTRLLCIGFAILSLGRFFLQRNSWKLDNSNRRGTVIPKKRIKNHQNRYVV